MLELLCEAVSLALQSLRLTLVHGGLAHARTLAIRISVVHCLVLVRFVFNSKLKL